MFAAILRASSFVSNFAVDRRLAIPQMASLGAVLIKLRKYEHKFLGFTGIGIDLLQSVHQFEVFGTELVDQRFGLFGERLDRLSIGVLLNRFEPIFELG